MYKKQKITLIILLVIFTILVILTLTGHLNRFFTRVVDKYYFKYNPYRFSPPPTTPHMPIIVGMCATNVSLN